MSRWYQPHEQWPRHPKPWWKETIGLARAAGWHLQEIDGHAWGRIVCDRDSDTPCKILIFSTGNGGESVAIKARRTIAACSHREAAGTEQVLVRATALLERAEALLQAAALCLQAEDKMTEAEDLLDGAATAADEAARIAQALVYEADGDRLYTEAFEVLPDSGQLGVPPAPAEVEALIGRASSHADQAEHLAEGLPSGDPRDAFRARIGQVRARVTQLSAQCARRRNADESPCA
ncbi:hypothetical protein DMH26_18515 [Streptomyces sp. WAC 05379]|uniref:hypothetical protein n=1 Tax=Streptomyces sp. WAC 05379 TaxID=2203207 RepID=UPI000F7424A7|nr:hypothetical protein [Streptomyces sp. WAC 05379]RSN98496.1 hypothetical protein DMH26_18515 [Streptomyces sp. WAC 05379]